MYVYLLNLLFYKFYCNVANFIILYLARLVCSVLSVLGRVIIVGKQYVLE